MGSRFRLAVVVPVFKDQATRERIRVTNPANLNGFRKRKLPRK
jgi:hypothetical protein